MEITEKHSITEKLIDTFKKAVAEVEDLRVQAALGKAEAKDLYEESKKKFNHMVHEAKLKLDHVKEKTSDGAGKIKSFFENLQVQLALGKAEGKQAFEEQSKKISHALHDLENAIRKSEPLNEYYTRLFMEIEKFKIKLAIVKLKYELKKLDALDEFESKKIKFMNHLAEIKTRLSYKEEKEMHKWEQFQDDVMDTFKRMRTVFAE